MEGQLAVPFHFAVEFLVLVVAVGAALDAARSRRHGAGAWAVGQMLGFLLLAGAQAAHGSLAIRADGAIAIVAARALAYALLAVSARPGAALTPTAAQMIAASSYPAFFLPGARAELAVVPAVAALAVAARGVQAHRKDQDPTTFSFAAAFVAFAAAEAATAFAPPTGGMILVAAHVARMLAALFLARWLWTSIVRSVRMRFVAAFVVVLTILVLAISSALTLVIGNTIADEESKRLADAARSRVTGVRNLADAAGTTAKTFALSEAVPQALDGRNDPDTTVQLLFRFAPADVDLIMLIDRDARVVSALEAVQEADGRHERPLPRAQALALAGSEVVAQALDTRQATGSVLSYTASIDAAGTIEPRLVTLAAEPVRGGAIAVGYRIDQPFLRGVREDTLAEATLVVGDRVAGTTFMDAEAAQRSVRAVATTLREAREERRPAHATVSADGRDFQTAFVPIQSEDGQVVGLLALSRPSEALAQAQQDITRTLFLITLAAMLIAAVLAWLSGGRVTRPIRSLTAAARELSLGNYDARATVASSDELGTLGAVFNEMAGDLEHKTEDLRRAAQLESNLRGRLEAVLQSMGDGLVATDANGVVVTFNRAAERMLGMRAEKVGGRPVLEVLKGTAKDGRALGEVAMTAATAEGRVARADGGGVSVALSATPLEDATGRTIGRVIVVRDVSREHEAERMKSEFLSNVSHELRTPITPIKGYAELLSRKRFPQEKMASFIEGILESTERLERIVDILVDFAALEAGRLRPREEAIPVAELLDALATRWKERDRAHRFVRKGGRELPPVLGDPRLLQRTLDELVDNAVKFSPGGGSIEISAEPAANGSRARRPSQIRILVRDQGIGIEPERLPDLFQDFRQLDGSETRTFGGLGLGLAYVKRIVQAHGGEVAVDSKPGRGSTFSLVLPVADGKGSGAAGSGSRDSRGARKGAAPPPAETTTGKPTAAKPATAKKARARSGGVRAPARPAARRATRRAKGTKR